jgi:hypothetical protein
MTEALEDKREVTDCDAQTSWTVTDSPFDFDFGPTKPMPPSVLSHLLLPHVGSEDVASGVTRIKDRTLITI